MTLRILAILALMFVAHRVYALVLDSGFYDDSLPMLTYSGTWATVSNANAVQGSLSESNSPASSVNFETVSEALTVYYLTHATGADMQVCIDADCTTLATSGSDAYVSAQFDNLPAGEKSISIAHIGTASESVRFDGVYIHPVFVPEAEVTPEPYVTYHEVNNLSGETFTAITENRLDTGDVLLFGGMVVQIILLITIIALKVNSNG